MAGHLARPGVGALRLWRAPILFLELFTGAKSFRDNSLLGSRRLNHMGLHVWRLKAAHGMARLRRARLARSVPQSFREQFERNGFIIVPNAVPGDDFARIQRQILEGQFDCRSQQQGDTITRRVPAGASLRRSIPELDRALRSSMWRALLAYVATTRSEPLFYIQTISSGIAEGPPDPQLELHSDTFHPSLKAWLYLTDVHESGQPFTYVAGSHRLTDERIEWEREKSLEVLTSGDSLSQRGSFRIRRDELSRLGLPVPTRFCVPANTLVIADTCGFHARAASREPAVRVELWAYCRRNPFVPWTWGGFLSWGPLARRQAELLYPVLDWLDRCGIRKQHWQKAGRRRPGDA
ncbi:MAG TPA: phytanoyl-CoA dioxygenase family protein [Sphingomicrobium sp.]|nr:phytanoyl-CoA dioxygenase family protein [Sphingomicrobium sp.]